MVPRGFSRETQEALGERSSNGPGEATPIGRDLVSSRKRALVPSAETTSGAG